MGNKAIPEFLIFHFSVQGTKQPVYMSSVANKRSLPHSNSDDSSEETEKVCKAYVYIIIRTIVYISL